MSKTRLLIVLVVFTVYFTGCNNSSYKKENKRNIPEKISENQLIRMNKYLVRQEKNEINRYIKSNNLIMKETASGLRYHIFKHGTGVSAQKGRIAVLRYKLSLLNGKVIDSSEKSGLKIFQIGHGGVVSGLEEGIILLKVGDKAKFILPSHLAYGLTGDGINVPPHKAIVYDVEFVQLK